MVTGLTDISYGRQNSDLEDLDFLATADVCGT
jgi:hypothetical protein